MLYKILYYLPGILFLGVLVLLSMFFNVKSELDEKMKENHDLLDKNHDLRNNNEMLKDENKNIKEDNKDFKVWAKDELKELVKEYKDEEEDNTKEHLIEDIKLLIKAIRK
ncbi:MAG: hypothetical protein ACTSQG_09885 [Promethearchaeota archaeon]